MCHKIPFYARIQSMSTTSKLVIDIETIGEDFEALDIRATRELYTKWESYLGF